MWAYLVAVWECRNFWLSLVVNDLQLRYRRSVLGVGWSLIHPLAWTLVMGAVFHEIFHQPIREYLPYLLCGLTCWTYLTGAFLQGCQSYIQAENYIRQHPLPLAVYPLRITLGAMIHFLIAVVLVLIMTVVLRGVSRPPEMFSLLLGIFILFLFGWAVTILAGFINIAFRDTQHIMEVVFQILFYLTPIIYFRKDITNPYVGWVLDHNPLTPFLDLIRCPLVEGRMPSLSCLGVALAVTLIVGLAAVASLSYQQRRVVFYL